MTINELIREYERAQRKSARWCMRRAELGPGTSRARLTTINAKWAIAAEHRDRLAKDLEERGITVPVRKE